VLLPIVSVNVEVTVGDGGTRVTLTTVWVEKVTRVEIDRTQLPLLLLQNAPPGGAPGDIPITPVGDTSAGPKRRPSVHQRCHSRYIAVSLIRYR